ncbi:MAG: hypothetical protein QXI58_01110 [Candidatus Micrarchaeia archaeon]
MAQIKQKRSWFVCESCGIKFYSRENGLIKCPSCNSPVEYRASYKSIEKLNVDKEIVIRYIKNRRS